MASSTYSSTRSSSSSSSSTSSRNSGAIRHDGVQIAHQRNRQQTGAIMYEFFEQAAEADSSLSHRDRIRMRETVNESVRTDVDNNSHVQVSYICRVVHILRNHGERIDQLIREDHLLQEATRQALEEDTDSSQSLITRVGEHLRNIIERFFEYEDGKPCKITIGRICTIFMYCYNICKGLLRVTKKSEIASWLIDLATCLAVNFAKAKFYEWLDERGGWLKALVELLPDNPVSQTLLGPPDKIPNNVYLVGGVVLIGIWAYNRYIRNY